MASVLIVDDHPAYRVGFGLVVQRVAGGTAVREAHGLREGLQALTRPPPVDLIVFDWHLPDGGGVGGLLAVLQEAGTTPVLVVSGDTEDAIGMIARELGAVAYLPKSASPDSIRQTVAALVAGGAARCPPNGGLAPANGMQRRKLSAREIAVLTCLARGLSNKEVGRELGISSLTTRSHVASIMATLGARNRTEAAVIGARLGLVQAAPRADRRSAPDHVDVASR